MADFTIGVNVRDGEIGITILLEGKDELFTIEEAESLHDVLGLQIKLARTMTHAESDPPRTLSYDRDAASRFR